MISRPDPIATHVQRQQTAIERHFSPPAPPDRSPADSPFSTAIGTPLDLLDFYRGRSLFLILSGPSARDLDLSRLNSRGIVTMGVNNSPAIFRPHLWTHGDHPKKFSYGIWSDPGIVKFVPEFWMMGNHAEIHRKIGDRAFEPTGLFPQYMPAVVGYRRGDDFHPSRWLAEPTITWGNSKKNARRNRNSRCLSVFFAALKIAFALGFRTVFLIGCDFRMDEQQPYCFDERKSAAGVAQNNTIYAKINTMCGALRPHFDAAGFRVVNCNPDSGLRAFEFGRFDDAVASASSPPDLDTRWHYSVNGR